MAETRKKSRRGNNEGSIYERPDRGCWEAQVTVNGQRITKTFKTRTEAVKWNREMHNMAETGITADAARLTWQDALNKWLEDGKSNWQPKTYSRYTEVVRLHIQPYIKPRMKVIDIKPDHVDAIINQAKEKELGIRTQLYILATLRKFFSFLVVRKVIAFNPAQAGQKIKYDTPEMHTWTLEQVQVFMKACEGDRHEHLYYLAFVTGMRQGELLGLKWSDINFLTGSIMIQRQVQWEDHPQEGKPRFFFKKPKSKKSSRQIPIGTETLNRLKQQRQQVTMQKMVNADKWQDLDLVFPNLVGNPVDPNNLIKEFRKLLLSVNLPKIRFHDIRHTCATLLLLKNVHPKVVSERLGHSDIRITLQTYTHAVPSLQNEASQIIEDLMNGDTLTSLTPSSPKPANRTSPDVLDL